MICAKLVARTASLCVSEYPDGQYPLAHSRTPGLEDDTIHAVASMKHYAHQISSDDDDTLEFVSSVRNVARLNARSDASRAAHHCEKNFVLLAIRD